MKLIKPRKLKEYDTVAVISLSGGRIGDPDMQERYEIGKNRLKEIFSLNVIESKHCLKGSEFIYKNPKARAEDLLATLSDPEIHAIFLPQGGDDGIRLLPYIDFDIIRKNPKIFLGFSDGSTFHNMFTYAGVSSYYGPNILATIAEPVRLNPYTIKWMKKVLFSDEVIGEITPCEKWNKIDWESKTEDDIEWNESKGYKIVQGKGIKRGHLLGGCGGPLQCLKGTCLFPDEKKLKGSIQFLETGRPYDTKLAGVHMMRSLAVTGMFKYANGLICGRISDEDCEDIVLKVLHEEGLYDLPVVTGFEFGHLNPMITLPIGVQIEIDCKKNKIRILESGCI